MKIYLKLKNYIDKWGIYGIFKATRHHLEVLINDCGICKTSKQIKRANSFW